MKKLCWLLLLTLGAWGQSIPSGSYYVPNYEYGLGGPSTGGRTYTGNAAVGVSTITLYSATVALPNGHTIMPYATNAAILVGTGATQETVTPTAVSGCYIGAPIGSCTITANFAFLHIQGEFVATGTVGLQEAINDATSAGGGTLVVDNTWNGTTALITNAAGNATVVIQDNRAGQTLYTWNGSNYVASNGTGVSPAFKVVNQAFNATESFNNNSSQNEMFVTTLTGNVTSSSVTSNTAGQVLEFLLCQDATGGRTFAWPANFNNVPTLNSAANACTATQFSYDTVTAKWQNTSTTAQGGVSVNASQVSSPNFGNSPAAGAGFINNTYQNSGANVSSEIPVSGNSAQVASAANDIHTATNGTSTCVVSGNITTAGCSAPAGAVATSPAGAQTIAQPSGTDLNVTVAGTGKVAFGGTTRIAGPEPWVDVNTPTTEGGVGCDPTGVANSTTCFQNAINKITATGGTIYTCGTYNFDLTVQDPGILINTQNESAIRFVSCGTAADNYGTSPVRGGTIFKSTSNVAIPNPSTAGTIALNGSGSVTGTMTMKYILVNGFGVTLPSPASSSVTAASNAVQVSQVPYAPGGWGYCAYWSSDGTNYFMQPNGNYASSGGTFGGQPFLVDNPDGTPSLTTFTASGTAVGPCPATPPASNTSTHAGVLAQVGNTTTVVNSAIEFNNIYWQDPSGVLGAGLVLAACNRCTVYHNAFEGFHANGSAIGGHAAYEQGGVGLAVGNYAGTGNFNELISNWFFDDTLGRYISASDTSEYGKNQCTLKSGQVCEDYVGGNLSEIGSHIDPSGTGQTAGFVWRGSQMASHYGGTLTAKVEGLASFSGPAVKMYAMKNSHIDLSYCGTNSAAAEACIVFDSSTTGNSFNIQNQGSQCAYSDGTTCLTDASSGGNNILSASGNVLNGTTNASFNLQSLSLTPSGAFASGVINVSPTNTGSVAEVLNCASGVTVDCFAVEINGIKQFTIDLNGKANYQASTVTSASFNMPFGQAPGSCNGTGSVGCVGDWFFVSPSSVEYVDANGTAQNVIADQIANVFQKQNTFVQQSPPSVPTVVMRSSYPAGSIPNTASDIFQVQDSSATPQIEFTKDFGIIANFFKTNGTQAGLEEFTSTSTDPVAIAVDANSFRMEAAVSSTHQTRFILPTQASTAAATQVWLTDACPNDANGVPKCTSSIGQVPNAALVNPSTTINGVAYTLGASANLGQLNDSNGKPTIQSTATTSATDFLSVANGSTASPTITLQASGTDANVSINLVSKGTGTIQCNGVSCGGGGGGGTQIAVNGTTIAGSAGSFGTSTSIIGTPSTQVTLGQHVGDAMAAQFVADSSTPTTNIVAYLPGVITSPHYRHVAWLQASSSWSNLGDVQAVTGTNSSAAPTANDGEMMNQATTTTSGSNAGVTGAAVSRTGRNIHYASLIELPDEASGLMRAWWGLTNATLANMLGSDTPAFSFAAFRFSTVASDTTFKCVVGNGTTTTVKDTTVTADANAHYFDLIFDDTTGNIQCAIDGVVKATFANTDAVPTSVNLLQFSAVQTETTATRNIKEGWMLTTADK